VTISVNPATRIITVPLADLTLVTAASGSFGAVYSYNVDAYRLELRDWEDSADGMGAPPTHNHNTEVTLAGVTYARVFEQVNGYTTTFELDTPAQQVSLFGANHNIGDVQNVNGVGLIINNSAGLQTVVQGSGLDTGQDASLTNIESKMIEVFKLLGLQTGITVTITPAGIDTSDSAIDIDFTGDGISSTVMERQ